MLVSFNENVKVLNEKNCIVVDQSLLQKKKILRAVDLSKFELALVFNFVIMRLLLHSCVFADRGLVVANFNLH